MVSGDNMFRSAPPCWLHFTHALIFASLLSRISIFRKAVHVCFGVKLRNTQQEQMSSALLPRTEIGLARPKYCADQVLWQKQASGRGAINDVWVI
jgi:hypothetical protein